MRNIWSYRAISTTLFLASLTLALPVSAAPPVKERLPLTLTGSGCDSKETEMNAVLQAIPGVIGVYFNRIPDHVLVDILPTTVKSADVITRVNEAASSWQCKVEFIEGCISAPMPTASATPHQHE
ncbi:MAG: hypothetical protein HC801_01810 [Nitrospira sp.]|nr:hypothetical protein [Nitrospira sp.]